MLVTNPPVELADGLFMLGLAEYPLYLYRGEGDATIFEGGVGAVAPLVLAQLDDLGVARDSVTRLVITHAHPDHVMAVPALRRALPKLRVLASAAAARTLANDKAMAAFAQIDAALGASLARLGRVSAEQGAEPAPPPATIAADGIVGEGDSIDAGGGAFDVLATPGHSECSLSFHQAQAGLLLISDAAGYYFPEHDYWWPNYFADYGAYLASMRRLAGLNAGVLCLSHNAAVRGAEAVRACFEAAIAAAEAYHGRIVEAVRSGTPPRRLGEQLGAEVFARTQLLDLAFFQKNCYLMVKLSCRHAGLPPEK